MTSRRPSLRGAAARHRRSRRTATTPSCWGQGGTFGSVIFDVAQRAEDKAEQLAEAMEITPQLRQGDAEARPARGTG